MAENNTSMEYNLEENSDCEGYKNENVGNNESIVPDSDPDSSDIEVSSDYTDVWDELDDSGAKTINDAIVTANANIPNWTTNFTDMII